MLPLTAVNWNVTQASDSCSPKEQMGSSQNNQSHTTLRRSNGNKTSRILQQSEGFHWAQSCTRAGPANMTGQSTRTKEWGQNPWVRATVLPVCVWLCSGHLFTMENMSKRKQNTTWNKQEHRDEHSYTPWLRADTPMGAADTPMGAATKPQQHFVLQPRIILTDYSFGL